TEDRNKRPKPWPYMYEPDSKRLPGLPIWPLGWMRSMSQSRARRMLSRYFPSRIVLPSHRNAMPASEVDGIGYIPLTPSKWPSLNCCFCSQVSPFLIISWYSLGTSSPRALVGAAPAKRASARQPARKDRMTTGSFDGEQALRPSARAGRRCPLEEE